MEPVLCSKNRTIFFNLFGFQTSFKTICQPNNLPNVRNLNVWISDIDCNSKNVTYKSILVKITVHLHYQNLCLAMQHRSWNQWFLQVPDFRKMWNIGCCPKLQPLQPSTRLAESHLLKNFLFNLQSFTSKFNQNQA